MAAERSRSSIDPGAQWTDRRWHTVTIDLPATSEAGARRQRLALDPRGGGDGGRQRLGALRRAALRVARDAAARCGARSRPSRGGFAPTACAVRSSSCARRHRRRTTPRPTRAGSRATRATRHDARAARGARSRRSRTSPSSASSRRSTTPIRDGCARASSRSGARPTRTGSCACATMPRRRRRPSRRCASTRADPRIRIRYLVGQRRHLGGVERGACDGARRVRRAARS